MRKEQTQPCEDPRHSGKKPLELQVLSFFFPLTSSLFSLFLYFPFFVIFIKLNKNIFENLIRIWSLKYYISFFKSSLFIKTLLFGNIQHGIKLKLRSFAFQFTLSLHTRTHTYACMSARTHTCSTVFPISEIVNLLLPIAQSKKLELFLTPFLI